MFPSVLFCGSNAVRDAISSGVNPPGIVAMLASCDGVNCAGLALATFRTGTAFSGCPCRGDTCIDPWNPVGP